MTKKQTPRQLAEKKLKSSGLSLKHLKTLGIEILSAVQVDKLTKRKYGVPGLKFNYFDVKGRKIKDIWRIRMLEQPRGKFGETIKVRYLQPSKTPPHAYFAPCLDWADIKNDVTQSIVITEGELKAGVMCDVLGFACIGLGGVYSWKSQKMGWSMLPELEDIEWKGRIVTLMFDSDAQTNPMVCKALTALVKELTARGAKVRIAQLPSLGEKGLGLDDYYVLEGEEALREVFDNAVDDELGRMILNFNHRFCYVLNPGRIYDTWNDVSYDPSKFHTSLFANVWANQEIVTKKGEIKLDRKKVAKEWLEYPLRNQANRFTFAPGRPRYVGDSFNTWSGWKVQPVAGDITPYKEFLDYIMTGSKPIERKFFENWYLYPLYKPGIKQNVACVFWSDDQGIGKSTLGVMMQYIMGEYAKVIGQDTLEGAFNHYIDQAAFVMIDDVSSHDSRTKADILKKNITQEDAWINIKGVPQYKVPDCANYFLTSNRANSFFLDLKDRRFFIFECTAERAEDEYFTWFRNWLKNEGGAEAVLYYAQHGHDFTGYNPYAAAPNTLAKQRMMDASKSEVEMWLTDLKRSPDVKLKTGKMRLERDIYTATELTGLFEPTRMGRVVTSNYMALRARDYFELADGGRLIEPGDEAAAEIYFVVRNATKWRGANTKQIEDHIVKGRKKEGSKKKGKF